MKQVQSTLHPTADAVLNVRIICVKFKGIVLQKVLTPLMYPQMESPSARLSNSRFVLGAAVGIGEAMATCGPSWRV